MNSIQPLSEMDPVRVSAWMSPPVLLTMVWAFVFLLRSLPFIYFEPLSSDAVFFLWSCYLGFVILYSLMVVPPLPALAFRAEDVRVPPIDKLVSLSMIFAVIGLVGAAVRGFDIYFGRGLDFSEGIANARLENIALVEMGGSGQNPIAGIARIMGSFASIAAMAVILNWEEIPSAKAKTVLAIFGLVLSQSILEGGRNTIGVNLLFVVSCAIVRRRQGKQAIPGGPAFRRAVMFILGSIPLFFTYVFVDRFEALGHVSDYAFSGLENLFNVEFSPSFTEWSSDRAIGLAASFAGIALYFTHAVNELGWVLEWSHHNDLAGGTYNFALVTVALQRLGLGHLVFDSSTLTREGVYMTALGGFVIDFGMAGAIFFCAVLGGFLGRWWRRARYAPTMGAELGLGIGMTALIVSPMYSIVAGFLGVLVAAVLFVLLLGHWPKRSVGTS